jgi:hypothetical protein
VWFFVCKAFVLSLYEEFSRGEKVFILLLDRVFVAEGNVTFASTVDGFNSLLLYTAVTLLPTLDRDTVSVCHVLTRAVLVEEMLCW